jgi:hypothetical protein
VTFEIGNASLTTLRARPAVRANVMSRPILPHSSARQPTFGVPWSGQFSGWWGSLTILLRRVPLQPLRGSIDLFHHTPVVPFRFAGRPLSLSLVLHCIGILVLPFLLAFSGSQDTSTYAAYEEPQKIYYYSVPKHDPFEKLPKITPSGEGGQPGAGQLQALLQKIGATTSARKIIIVSKPIHPDNKRQTIYQPATPPDLRINMDLKLPNIVGAPPVVPKPQVHFNPKDSKPLEARRSATRATAPTLAATNAAVPTSLPAPTVAQPHLAVPINSESRPLQAQVVIGQVTAPSLAQSNVATATNLGDAYRTGEPSAPEAPPSDGQGSGSGKSLSSDPPQIAGDGSGVVVVGIDPADSAALVNLPAGNRWGDFSIAPGGGQPGAVGGAENGVHGAGSSLSGEGGDRVAGVGHGYSGGGGGSSGFPGSLSISGGGAGGNGNSTLDPTIIRDMVFAVPSTVILRKNALIVSTGPIGGGGLDAYGALHCGKIYTVFLAMPGKSWTLQFCQSGGGPANPASQNRSAFIKLDEGLLPPDLESRFDFRRLPVPFEKKNKPIVLKGIIKDDGTVANLEVYQSIVPEMDEAARVAFSRFKFKPAMRAGKPVAVDVLIGIPTDLPATRSQ